MPRQPNDGRGRLGGRGPGVGNKKENPIRPALRSKSVRYYTPCITVDDGLREYLEIEIIRTTQNPDYILTTSTMCRMLGAEIGEMVSRADIDEALMRPADRARVNADLLKYHTASVQSTSLDINTSPESVSLAQRLAALAAENQH